MAPLPSMKPAPPERDGHRLAELAKAAIAEALGGPRLDAEERRAAEADFPGPGASFVTLKLDEALRGCIGGLTPEASLVQGVLRHARAAAFEDPRFEPLHAAELPRLSVEVSLLSELQPLACADHEDLQRQLHSGVDGLKLDHQGRSATFLPQVWTELPESADFVSALQRKAGWSAKAWPSGLRAWTYTVEAWRDEPRPARTQAPSGPAGAGFLYPARHWHRLRDGRLRCDVCPHGCALREGQSGRCLIRRRHGDRLVLLAYGRSSGLCVDPIEKKPLHHFFPGSTVLSFGTLGCNLSCHFCQNWRLSRARDLGRLGHPTTPESVAASARSLGCRSVAFTYNEPATALEYVSDVAEACHAEGIATVAVTAGYMEARARRDFFRHLDGANVDLKAFSEDFYHRVVGGSLRPVLDTLRYLVRETQVWTEITTLLIPGLNDSDAEIGRLAEWIVQELGPDVPLHVSAFHPDHRLLKVPPTPPATLRRARLRAYEAGLNHVYTGNVRDAEGATTYCPGCSAALLQRDGFRLWSWNLDAEGRCQHCGTALPGRFDRPFSAAT